MIDSDLIINPNKRIVLNKDALIKTADRFLLNQTEKEAENYFKNLINQCIDSVIAAFWDKLHIWVVNNKK